LDANEFLLKENGHWLHYSKPIQIVIAQHLGDVTPALQEVERLVRVKEWHAAGFLSYESAPAFDRVIQTHPESGFPLVWFGLYLPPRIVDLPQPASTKPALSWRPTVDHEMYNSAIEQIKGNIADGRTYQVNYTMRLQSKFNADPWNFFLHLAQTQNNHAAFVNMGRWVVCSASPELFFQLDGETITCRPMKGTVKRGRTTLEDNDRAEWLHNSEKNRAENAMIVDMIRNDLGRIAVTGSVHTPEFFSIEKYPTLWQMTSTVQAKTSSPITEIFRALFPCASITGAPKVSTMRIISELETTPRNIYTGAIGVIAPDRKAKFNVAIRTALIDREGQTAEYGIGGGVVWDSTNADEYDEAMLKARVLTETQPPFSLLETMLWTPNERFFLREKHIVRLLDSAKYFDFPVSEIPWWLGRPNDSEGMLKSPRTEHEIIESFLDYISSQFTSPQRVRLLLDKNGKLSFESKPFTPSENLPPLKVSLAEGPVNSENALLFHKTTQRGAYDSVRNVFPDVDDVLLYNENNELTEFTIGNLVVEMDGILYTPPISCGLLAGTFRAHLLRSGQVKERVIHAEELAKCSKIFLVNSVQKWRRVEIV
jgi:para-aminobenzoate synthetase/4-amino-4-deoxychorismate lyase